MKKKLFTTWGFRPQAVRTCPKGQGTDAFQTGRWKYTFQNVCQEDSKIPLNDKTTKIFFNTKGTKGSISKEAKRILELIEGNVPEDGFSLMTHVGKRNQKQEKAAKAI